MKEEATLKTLKDYMSGEKNQIFNFPTITPNKQSGKFMKPSILCFTQKIKLNITNLLF